MREIDAIETRLIFDVFSFVIEMTHAVIYLNFSPFRTRLLLIQRLKMIYIVNALRCNIVFYLINTSQSPSN